MSRLSPPASGSTSRHEADPPDFVQRGKVLIVQRQFQEAVKVCRLGLLGHPTYVEGRLVLGMALMALGRHEEVLAEMNVALELDANSPMGHLLRGEALLRKGDLQRAYDALLRAHDLDPLNEKVRRLLLEVEEQIDPEEDAPDRPRTSTKVYPAPAAQRLPRPRDASLSNVSSISVVSEIVSDSAIVQSEAYDAPDPREVSKVVVDEPGYPPFADAADELEDETDVSDDWGSADVSEEVTPQLPEGRSLDDDAPIWPEDDEVSDLDYEEEDESFTTAPWLPPQRFRRRRERGPLTGDGPAGADTAVDEARVKSTDSRSLRGVGGRDLPIEAPATVESSVELLHQAAWAGTSELEVGSVDVSTAVAAADEYPRETSGAELVFDDPDEGGETEVNYDAPAASTLFGEEEGESLEPPLAAAGLQQRTTKEISEDEQDEEPIAGVFSFEDDGGDDDEATATAAYENDGSAEWDLGAPRRTREATAAVSLPAEDPDAKATASHLQPVDVLPGTVRDDGHQALSRVSSGTEILADSELEADESALGAHASPGAAQPAGRPWGAASADWRGDEEVDDERTGERGDLSVPRVGDVAFVSQVSLEEVRDSADDWGDADLPMVDDPGTAEISLDAIEILPDMPPVPPESAEHALPRLPANLPALPRDAQEDFAAPSAQLDQGEISQDSDLETRVNFDGLVEPKNQGRSPAAPAYEDLPYEDVRADAAAPDYIDVPYDDGAYDEPYEAPRPFDPPEPFGAPEHLDAPLYGAPEHLDAPKYDARAPYDAPGPYDAEPYDAQEPYAAPGPYDAPAPYDAPLAYDPYDAPSHLDEPLPSDPSDAPYLDEPRGRPLAPSHLDDPPPQLEDRLGPYPGWPGEPVFEPAPVDYRPSVPAVQDSGELRLEAPAEGYSSPQRTAALGADEGRLRPYVEKKPGTQLTSPGGPRGLRALQDIEGRPRVAPANIHDQMTGEAQMPRAGSRRAAQRDRTSWVTLMLGDPGRQRWMRGAIAAGIVALALAGGFLFRYLRIGHQVDRKRMDAASLLRLGNLRDFVAAARKYDDIVKSKHDKQWAWRASVRINAAIPFEFGDPSQQRKATEMKLGLQDEQRAAITIYRSLEQRKLTDADSFAFDARKIFTRSALIHYLAGRILLLRGSTEAATTQLKRAVELDDRDCLILRAYGDALLERGENENALKAYQRALKLNPHHVATLLSMVRYEIRARRLAEAKSLLLAIVSGEHKPFASRGQLGWAYALQARVAAREGRVALARTLVDRARSHAPDRDPTFYDALADVLIDAFSLGGAERFAKRSEDLMPGRPHPQVNKARIYLLQGRAQAAWAELERSHAEVSSLLRARIQLRLGRIADAERNIKLALRRAPSIEAELLLAKTLAAQKNYDGAEDKLQTLLTKRPKDARLLTALGEVLLQKRRLDAAQRQFELAIRNDDTALEAKLRLADVLLMQGKFDEAHRSLIAEHRRNSWYVPILRRLAEFDLGARNLTEARKNLERVLEIVPQDVKAQLNLVKVLTMQRRFVAAGTQLGKIKGAAPGALELASGRLALERGNAKEAEGKLNDARRLLAGDPEPWVLLVRTYVFENRLNEASAIIQELEKRFPKLPESAEAQGRLLLNRAKPRKAVAAFRTAVERLGNKLSYPIDQARLLTLLGQALNESGKVDDALTQYQKAIAICKACPLPRFREGLALDELKKPDAAIRSLKHAMRLAPKMLGTYAQLAKIYGASGRTSEAIKMWEKYLLLEPPEELAREARQSIEDLKLK